MNILGSQARLDLEYKPNDWNTVIIQYSNITPLIEDECIFILNRRRGFFKLRYDEKEEKDIYIGGHPQKQNVGGRVLSTVNSNGLNNAKILQFCDQIRSAESKDG